MSSANYGDFFGGAGRSSTNTTHTNFFENAAAASSLRGPQQQQQHNHHQFSLPSPLLPDPVAQIHRPDYIGKRSLAEFQSFGFNLRNVKPRLSNNIYQYAPPISSLGQVDLPPMIQRRDYGVARYGFPAFPVGMNCNGDRFHGGAVVVPPPRLEENTIFSQRLMQLEKELLCDDDDGDETAGENLSIVTNSEWSAESFQNLLRPTGKPVALSPAPSPSSSSTSCSSTLASPPLPPPKQSLIDAAFAVSEGQQATAMEILTRLQRVASAKGTPEQRLTRCMLSALKSRANPTENPPAAASELDGEAHVSSIQMLYDASVCFKLGFMSANLAVLEATAGGRFDKIHILDFDVGHGKQYVHLLHALAPSRNAYTVGKTTPTSLRITATFSDPAAEARLMRVGEGLKSLAEKIGIPLSFHVVDFNLSDLTRENLGVNPDEALVVNFTYKLYKIADESVTTENLRDGLLRTVRSLAPEVVTVVEQELNLNTAPLATRVREACDHYGALFESLDAAFPRDSAERVRIEAGLGRRISNAISCEGRERVERCEVFGKWRARMGMAGFKVRPVSPKIGENFRSKLSSLTRGNPGFTVADEAGGVCFGWKGKALTVASAWQ